MSVLAGYRIVPVVAIPDAELAVPLAGALADGGLPVVEVTLRTPAALEAIARIRAELPDVLCGAGTLLSPDDVARAADAGAQFLVSPGATEDLLAALVGSGLPSLPGAATASEAMRLAEHGITEAKFFPAEAAGGVAALSALGGPLPMLRWCATGGVTQQNAPSYLALRNVLAVGGSWMVPSDAVVEGDWARVRALAAHAALLAP